MEEDELLPGIEGTTFEIRLGEQGDVLPAPDVHETAIAMGARVNRQFEQQIVDRRDFEAVIPAQYIVGYDGYTQNEDGDGAIGVITYRRLDNGNLIAEYNGRETEIPRHNPFPTQEATQRIETILDEQAQGRMTREPENVQIIELGARRHGRTENMREMIDQALEERRNQYPIEPDGAFIPTEAQLENLREVARQGGLIPVEPADTEEIRETYVRQLRAINDDMDRRTEDRRTRELNRHGVWTVGDITTHDGTTTTIRTAGLTEFGEVELERRGDTQARPITAQMIRDAVGVTYARPVSGHSIHPRNVRGLKNHMSEFLEQLHRRNEIHGETLEKILEHLNEF